MRIVMLTEHYSKKMGYIENCLPKALARFGHEVHVVTTTLQANYRLGAKYSEIYEEFLGPEVQPAGTEQLDGFTLHRLPHSKPLGYSRPRGFGLLKKLRALRPDIVQAHAAASWVPLEAALWRPFLGYKLFTAAHVHASVMPVELKEGKRWTWARLKSDLRRALPGRFVSLFTEKCYPISNDCAEMAIRFYGVQPNKVDVCPLGVDTELFHPVDSDETRQRREELRRSLGFAPTDIVCIYTGRFEQGKNPLCLARAIDALRAQGEPYRAVFIGTGPQQAEIAQCSGCSTHPFMAWGDLPPYYRAADIGVWPRQESLSMLDAVAAGLPIVLSDHVKARERIDGNGLTYKEDDSADMMLALLKLKDEGLRRTFGAHGCQKMRDNYSWLMIAQRRLNDYEAALKHGKPSQAPAANAGMWRPDGVVAK